MGSEGNAKLIDLVERKLRRVYIYRRAELSIAKLASPIRSTVRSLLPLLPIGDGENGGIDFAPASSLLLVTCVLCVTVAAPRGELSPAYVAVAVVFPSLWQHTAKFSFNEAISRLSSLRPLPPPSTAYYLLPNAQGV